MKDKMILYFCNCYLVMLDYDETLEEIVQDFVSKEKAETILELKTECNNIIQLPNTEKEKVLKTIIGKADDLVIETIELETIIQNIVKNI